MDAEQIRSMRAANPFRPFRLWLKDGRQFDVLRPLHVAIAENGSRVLVASGSETASWFSPEDVAAAEMIVHPTPILAREGAA